MPTVKEIAENKWAKFHNPIEYAEDILDISERENLSSEKRIERLEDEVRMLQKHVRTLAKALLDIQQKLGS